MEKLDSFRRQLQAFVAGKRGAQAEIVKKTGVPQYVVSRFLSGGGLPGRYVLPLYELFEGEKRQPSITPTPPDEARP